MYRILLLLCLSMAALPVWAAGGPTSGPNADTVPVGAKPPETPEQTSNCPERPQIGRGAPSNVVVELDPDTLWRPRGSEVRFTVRGPSSAVIVKQVRVCFGWSSPGGQYATEHSLIGSPQVRSVSTENGTTEYGAVVPRLRRVPWADWWPRRLFSTIPYVFSGAGTVPVADMVVEVSLADNANTVVTTAIQVGVTSGSVAVLIMIVVVALIVIATSRIANKRKPDTWGTVLWIISTPDGQASLSQLQIVLWTVVVGLSAIYVMTLSGNLISISGGTLTLLGIAGGTALVARMPGAGQPSGPATTMSDTPSVPRWADMIIPDRQSSSVDVTRLQMLSFTLIAAGFVLIKVVVDYEIPAIPPNFLILMGISNGVYVAGRKWPGSTPSAAGIDSKKEDAPEDG